MTTGRGRRMRHGGAVRGVSLLGVGVVLAAVGGAAGLSTVTAPDASASVHAAASSTGGPVTKKVVATRTHLVAGSDQVVDTRTVTLAVSRTQGLRDRDGLFVSWSGAHPTGGLVLDPTSYFGAQEEYPMVLLECRGLDSSTAPAAQRLTPDKCWTQSPRERYLPSYSTAFPPWRVDRYAAAGDRVQFVGAPTPRPAACPAAPATGAEHWLPWSAPGVVYPGGPVISGCYSIPPEATPDSTTAGLPGNTIYGQTGVNGSGSAKFDVRTAESNSSLGCSSSVACALVAVPVMGISCDVAAAGLPVADQPAPGTEADAAQQLCATTGAFPPGQFVTPQGQEDLSVSGFLWWSASNWRNRITVPLNFAPPSNICDLASAKAPVNIYGSELMIQATEQWAPKFCLDKSLFPFKHVQTGEPQAVNLLKNGTILAALGSRPPDGGFVGPVVSAPVASTGFAITFTIDGTDKQPVPSLRLTPRLLAKLLTSSYPAIQAVADEYAALSKNPLNVSLDPEFIALNPGIQHGVPASESASALLALSSDSDVMYALTSYINADPEARAWVNGEPDPWGMVVNPNYKKLKLPVQSWPLLDSFEPPGYYQPGINDCLHDTPVPYLPLVAAPTQRLPVIGLDMQYSLAPSQVVCDQPQVGSSVGEKLVALGRQAPGFRFMIGVMSLGDADRFEVNAAQLQTHVDATALAKFTDSKGRTFVAPTDASLRAASKLFKASASANTWAFDYPGLLSNPANAAAYPGTMLVYASLPTRALSSRNAANLATWLRYVAGPGQVRGTAVGQLPAGYLPLTSANGLGAQSAYTLRAVSAVAAQTGSVPSITGGNVGSSGPQISGGGGGNPGPSPSTGPSAAASTPSPSVSPTTTIVAEPVGRTQALSLGAGGLLLPGLLVLAGLAACFGGLEILLTMRRRRA